MILQTLVDYYETLSRKGEIPPLGWCLERAAYCLNISRKGKLLGVIPMSSDGQQPTATANTTQLLQVPERVVRSSGIKPNFLCDNVSYLLGFDNKGKPKRTLECFAECKKLHLRILGNAQGTVSKAIRAFFATWDPATARQHPAIEPIAQEILATNLVFMIDSRIYAHDDPEVIAAWQEYYELRNVDKQTLCMVTGQVTPIALIHGKIKGLRDAQRAGASLISFNAPAYESYGNDGEDRPNAPIGAYAAFAYVTALNHLIADKARRSEIGDTMVIYWSENADVKAQELFAAAAMFGSDDENAYADIRSDLAAGIPVEDIDLKQQFYVLGLSPNTARISVSFFLQDTLGSFLGNIKRHQDLLKMVKPPHERKDRLSIPMLLAETVNPNSREKSVPPPLVGSVMRAILTGSEYPPLLYQTLLSRIRSERRVNYARAATIKAYLLKSGLADKSVLTDSLNEKSDNRAYVLGRLFAALEYAQRHANTGITTTIKERYFAQASVTPDCVFPRLIRMTLNQVGKAGGALERQSDITKMLDRLNAGNEVLPAYLSLSEQGVFVLGYYHQVQKKHAKKGE